MNETTRVAAEFAFTSDFWSLWVALLTLANILACWWLIRWTARRRAGEAAEGDVTGHTWDGDLREYNNPLPRWWLWLFYITLVFGLVYLVLYPGLGSFRGLLGWSQQQAYAEEMQAADTKYGPLFARFSGQPVAALAKDPDAQRIGRRLFLNYCATCHGSDAGGAPGFPSLRDRDWLWGGTPEAIETSILDGRQGNMPAWGQVLGEDGVADVAEYVLQQAGRDHDAQRATRGAALFKTYCAACHGSDARGNPALGAPNLTDGVWLYGGSRERIRQSIRDGRKGRMPAHRDFLGEDKVHLLAAYVYGLSEHGGSDD